jgi:uncharacterized membrane protein YhaH (DUF805 family)
LEGGAAVQYFFGFEGRAERGTYWFIGLLSAFATALVVAAAVGLTAWQVPGALDLPKEEFRALLMLRVIGLAPLLLLFFIMGLSVTVRRLHDRNRSGFWALLCYSPTLLRLISIVFGASELSDIAGGLALIVGVWTLVDLGLLPGTKGANRFGDPVHPDDGASPAPLSPAFSSADRALTAAIERRTARGAPIAGAPAAAMTAPAAPRRQPQPGGFGRKLAH